MKPFPGGDLGALESRISGLLGKLPASLGFLKKHVLLSPGKRRRGILFFMLAREFGVPREKMLTVAAALEIVHLSTLIHDDILDGAFFRRNSPALHRVCGTAPALLFGDLLLIRGIGAVTGLDRPELTALLLETGEALCAGAILEERARGGFPWGERLYFRIADGKTASLFSFACRAPGLLGGLPPERLKVLSRLGRDLGRAYQIADDCLDFVPGSGKEPLSDLKNRLPNLALILAGRERSVFARLQGVLRAPPGKTSLEEAARLVRRGGGLEAASRRAVYYLRSSLRLAAALPPGGGGDQLRDYLRESLSRLRSLFCSHVDM